MKICRSAQICRSNYRRTKVEVAPPSPPQRFPAEVSRARKSQGQMKIMDAPTEPRSPRAAAKTSIRQSAHPTRTQAVVREKQRRRLPCCPDGRRASSSTPATLDSAPERSSKNPSCRHSIPSTRGERVACRGPRPAARLSARPRQPRAPRGHAPRRCSPQWIAAACGKTTPGFRSGDRLTDLRME